jgi:hypothetical protein
MAAVNRVEGTAQNSHAGTIGKFGDGLSPDLNEERDRAKPRE